MILFLVAYLGGVLTVASPCVLPVLPFVFASAGRSFLRSGLPMLVSMALTFAGIASLAAVAGGWAVEANRYGRFAALCLLALFGLALLFPSLSDRLTKPLVALGSRISARTEPSGASAGSMILRSCLLGVATGLLWAPCAGPVLGIILTGAALHGANVQTSLLLLTYALGAATSMALAVLAGGRVFAAMKRSLGAGEWIRRGFGLVVLIAVAAIWLGLDTGLLTRVSLASTNSLEQSLLDRFHSDSAATGAKRSAAQAGDLQVEGVMPSLSGATDWLNSPPLTPELLKGKVVLIDFWTYSCINCLRTIPYIRAWAEKYKDQGLVVIGVHSPEFAFEKNIDNVRKAVADLKIQYPVAVDSNQAIWRAFHNEYWPAHYFIDSRGNIRHHQFGESGKEQSERVIQRLLAEAGKTAVPDNLVAVNGSGAEAAPDSREIKSLETYIGYDGAEGFVSPGDVVEDERHVYSPGHPALNQWSLSGDWTVGSEHAALNRKGGRIIYRFHSRDLHLVLGPAPDGKPIRFRITIDGAAPGSNHGADTDAQGRGSVTGQRLYQLIRQSGAITDRTFEIEFLDPGVQAFAFTFG